ncbi:unnamed protein product [Rhizophagus irregularis]|uniref:Uncharacterized protein n=2 Tax=Rhizophagus irregularis TaxID=588596 RepID=A0A2N1NK14_9GLOM|nr:hypothetical protein RhiirC2_846960 [Rhizophagus irregularis]CAB4390960.1 unnamed protein product [Rhizophagus irregularis]CAB5391855.1 unnamed protein product [Rhizophagus irregularis]
MSSTQPSELSPDTKDQMDKVNSFNLSMLIGLLIITIAVLIIMSIIMNIWMKKKKSKIVPYVHEKHLPTVTSKESKTDKLLSLHLLTPPKLVFNKDTTLPVYRKTDTWDRYLKMIQSPAKLNDIVRTMKIDHSPLSNVVNNFPENSDTNDNEKISYDNNNNNCYNHILQREPLHLQQKTYNHNNYHYI